MLYVTTVSLTKLHDIKVEMTVNIFFFIRVYTNVLSDHLEVGESCDHASH